MFKKCFTFTIMALIITLWTLNSSAAEREYITIAGSSTVYPFATVVAETFGKTTHFKTPRVESTGSGGGLKLFCEGIGINTPDITNASRRIKQSEIDRCGKNGVKDIVEVKIGYDGIVLANSRKAPHIKLTKKAIFLALAKQVPDPSGAQRLITNPYHTWKEIDTRLPADRIEVLGPPPTSGTRDAFVELVMEGGARTFPWIKALKKKDKHHYKEICHTLREDGAYIEAGENDNLIVQKLEANPHRLGIFGFSFLDQNMDMIQGSYINGVEPTFEAISDGTYPIARPLFFYVKKAHVGMIPGIPEYVREFTSEKTWGPDGYLSDRGLIPMSDREREKYRRNALKMVPMKGL